MEVLGADVHNATGCLAIPGLVDMHVHITGGGGEASDHHHKADTLSAQIGITCQHVFQAILSSSSASVQAGPASRTPESQLSAFLDAGITTLVGLLGTDCYTRRQVRPPCASPQPF